jgi:hypothetical protein
MFQRTLEAHVGFEKDGRKLHREMFLDEMNQVVLRSSFLLWSSRASRRQVLGGVRWGLRSCYGLVGRSVAGRTCFHSVVELGE